MPVLNPGAVRAYGIEMIPPPIIVLIIERAVPKIEAPIISFGYKV